MRGKEVWGLILRYVVLFALGVSKLKFFYYVFTPLTVFPVFWVISLFDPNAALLEGNLLFFSGLYAEIIPACVAGAAYYLLLILNLTTPMEKKQRVYSILFLTFTFLASNIGRILIFAALAASGTPYFDLAHRFVWYFGSTILVVLVWFLNVWLFKVRSIPIYTDMRGLFGEVLVGKRK